MVEIKAQIRGFNRRCDLYMDMVATLASWNMASHVRGRPPTPQKLRGKREIISQDKPTTKEEFFAPMKAAKRKLEQQQFEQVMTPFQKLTRGDEDEDYLFRTTRDEK